MAPSSSWPRTLRSQRNNTGSNPVGATNLLTCSCITHERFKFLCFGSSVEEQWSSKPRVEGSNPSRSASFYAFLAQLEEHRSSKPRVVGSSPTGGAKNRWTQVLSLPIYRDVRHGSRTDPRERSAGEFVEGQPPVGLRIRLATGCVPRKVADHLIGFL